MQWPVERTVERTERWTLDGGTVKQRCEVSCGAVAVERLLVERLTLQPNPFDPAHNLGFVAHLAVPRRPSRRPLYLHQRPLALFRTPPQPSQPSQPLPPLPLSLPCSFRRRSLPLDT